MLDMEIIEQLKTHMIKLDREVVIVINKNEHEKKSELVSMLEDVASTSALIKIAKEDNDRHPLHFVIQNHML